MIPIRRDPYIEGMEYAYVNGKVVPAREAKVSVFDRGLVLGDGLFETLRAVEFRPQFLPRHYRRMAGSAKKLRIPLPLEMAAMGAVIEGLCCKSRLRDAAVRITLTRGLYQGGLAIDPRVPPSLFITVMPVTGLSEKLYAEGVKVAISSVNKAAASGLDARIKSTNYLANIFAKAEADRKGCYEAILLGPDGEIAELTTSSFFCVKDGTVLTPPIALGILPGITRQVLLEILKRRRIPFAEKAVRPEEVASMSEAFLSSSVRGLVPIRRIENRKVGDGKPGPVFAELRRLYAEACSKELQKTEPGKRA